MKKLFFVSGILMLSCYAIGQARDGTADLKKSRKAEPAAMIDLPYAPTVVQSALTNYLSKTSKNEQIDAKDFLLSCNTSLVKSNIKGAEMVFEIGKKDLFHPNETVVYLKLHSNVQNNDKADPGEHNFDMTDAISYLENLSVAIGPYAKDLQLKLQKKDLKNARKKSVLLTIEGVNFEQDRTQILKEMASANTDKKTAKLEEKKLRNKQQIDMNIAAKTRNDKEIDDQISAIALLEKQN